MLGRPRAPSLLLILVILVAGGCAYKAQTRAAGWTVVDTEHVRVRTPIAPKRAAELAGQLQAIRDTLAATVMPCAFHGKRDPILVTILPQSEYSDIAPEHITAHYRAWSVAWLPEYEGQIVMPDRLRRETRQIYQHELAHHLIESCLPRAPIWLHEGLASFVETVVVEPNARQVVIGLPPFIITKERRQPEYVNYRGVRLLILSRDLLPPVARMLRTSAGELYYGGAHDSLRMLASYATAWALVHMLELGAPDLRDRFHRFLGGLRQLDADPNALFAAEFEGVDLQARLTRHLLDGRWPNTRRPAPAPRNVAARVSTISAGDAHVHWAWLWSSRWAGERSEQRVREHLAAARQHPASRARAHLVAATLRLAARDPAGAEREVMAGLRLAPRDPQLLHAQVELLLERGADVSGPAGRLAAVARTGEQLCALAEVELARGRAQQAHGYAARGLAARPSSSRCRRSIDRARQSLRARGPQAPPES
jgi:hypothetical protein